MKQKEKKELFSRTPEELKQILKEVETELFKNKLLHAQKKLKNTSSLNESRKKVAQIMTILRERQLVQIKAALGGKHENA